MLRRVLAVIGCIMIGMSIGGVLHARDRITEVRQCVETEPGVMECDDDTTCYWLDGVWVCEDNAPHQLH